MVGSLRDPQTQSDDAVPLNKEHILHEAARVPRRAYGESVRPWWRATIKTYRIISEHKFQTTLFITCLASGHSDDAASCCSCTREQILFAPRAVFISLEFFLERREK